MAFSALIMGKHARITLQNHDLYLDFYAQITKFNKPKQQLIKHRYYVYIKDIAYNNKVGRFRCSFLQYGQTCAMAI